MKTPNEFSNLVKNSDSIFITSHISPDPDAISSVLLLGTSLLKNFPGTKILMALEEEPEGLGFLAGYKLIHFGNLYQAMTKEKPDLFILLDAVNYERCSRNDGKKIRQFLSDNEVKTAIIDHHEPIGADKVNAYIHQGSIATAMDVYEVCFEHLGLAKPDGYGETTMVGIWSDSGGFTYTDKRHMDTFKLVDELITSGVSLEAVKSRLNQFSLDHMAAIAEFAKNVTGKDDHTYTFLSDEFVFNWQNNDKPLVSLNTASGFFSNDYIRNIGGRRWGYVIYRNPTAGDNIYSVSFRSENGVKDVSKIANSLGGGGHKPAAGAKIEAENLDHALQKVESAISNT